MSFNDFRHKNRRHPATLKVIHVVLDFFFLIFTRLLILKQNLKLFIFVEHDFQKMLRDEHVDYLLLVVVVDLQRYYNKV